MIKTLIIQFFKYLGIAVGFIAGGILTLLGGTIGCTYLGYFIYYKIAQVKPIKSFFKLSSSEQFAHLFLGLISLTPVLLIVVIIIIAWEKTKEKYKGA